MDAIKIHVGSFSDDGTVDCDYRNPDGSEKIGAAQGDHHSTIFEIDPATQDQVDLVKELGPRLNQLFVQMVPKTNALGIKPGVRIGVWPGDGRA